MADEADRGEPPYVFVDGVYLKRSRGGEVQNMSVLVAVGVKSGGYREILGVAEGSREDGESSWRNFFRYLKKRGLAGVRLVASDKASGLTDALGDFHPDAKWRRCVVHWYRNAFGKCPREARTGGRGHAEGVPLAGGQGCRQGKGRPRG